jgi:hypothetical protein
MGIDSTNIPENIRQCMPQEARKAMNAPTSEEVGERVAVKLEKELHDQFQQWCAVNDIDFIHARMDQRSTIRKGHPDFTLLRDGRGCCIEFKRPGGKLSDDQTKVIWRLKLHGVPVEVFDDIAEAITFARQHLGMNGGPRL